ncbi:hypothetical protein CEXT_268651 [Caerostris extrusa]|uniref:Uncharacterized protein n=1 Tax=Caerostris extrusa TaxID=172846 RepID=A0AAV4NGH2_CAEEX|nr:hypothetical protein CEXT_268651 [Caerostris extrusa]
MINVQQLQPSRNLIKILKQKQAGLEKIPQSKIICDVKKTDELAQSKLTAQNDKCSAVTAIKKSDQNTEAKQAGLEKFLKAKLYAMLKRQMNWPKVN